MEYKFPPGCTVDGSALFLEESATIVVSDLHIGFEEESREGGVLLVDEQRAYFRDRFAALFARHEPACIVLNGDIKHAFGRISQQEWSDVTRLITSLQERCAVRVVAGNHDTMLAPILARLGIELERAVLLGDLLIVHGDATLEELVGKGHLDRDALAQVTTIICGHEHPGLLLTDGVRAESLRCFLIGPLDGRRCVVTPAFNPLSGGVDVLRDRPLGPLLTSFDPFTVFGILDDGLAEFGSVRALKALQEE